jgi:CMP-N-acetylneuraminic acid synthetase
MNKKEIDLVKNVFISEDDMKILEQSEEYKTLISRKTDLNNKINNLVNEIYEYRKFQATTENLVSVKTTIENEIKNIDNQLQTLTMPLRYKAMNNIVDHFMDN